MLNKNSLVLDLRDTVDVYLMLKDIGYYPKVNNIQKINNEDSLQDSYKQNLYEMNGIITKLFGRRIFKIAGITYTTHVIDNTQSETQLLLYLDGSNQILDEMYLDITLFGRQYKIFCPIFYYMIQDVQKCGRVVVYKKDNGHTRYLVHRANTSDNQLRYPGGHIEYIEFNRPYTELHSSPNDQIQVYSGKEYLSYFIRHCLKSITASVTTNTVNTVNIHTYMGNSTIMDWIKAGAIREVDEESGLTLYNRIHELKLLKIGEKTFYFGIEIELDAVESGPRERFTEEVYKLSDGLKIGRYLTIYKKHTYSFRNKITTELDIFWQSISNRSTHHAWITTNELRRYWPEKYKDHIDVLIDMIEDNTYNNLSVSF